MVKIKRSYIDSHWLTFLIRGIISLLFGWITLFHSNDDFPSIITVVGIYLIILSIIEFFNALHRVKAKSGWIVSILAAIIDIVAAFLLLLTPNKDIMWHYFVIAIYTIIRSVSEIIMGFRTTIDPTDRFIWIITGICGTIMGFVILNSGSIDANSFIRFFGAYLLIFGVSSMIYSIDNKKQMLEDHEARVEARKNKKSKSTKSTKKK